MAYPFASNNADHCYSYSPSVVQFEVVGHASGLVIIPPLRPSFHTGPSTVAEHNTKSIYLYIPNLFLYIVKIASYVDIYKHGYISLLIYPPVLTKSLQFGVESTRSQKKKEKKKNSGQKKKEGI